jgi:hypothetical protein
MAAGLSHATWSRIERGERSANNRFVLARMAQAMRCPVSDLTGERAVPGTREAATIGAAVTEAFRAIVAADPEYPSASTGGPPLDVLKERVSNLRRLRVACDYANALRVVPETVRGLHGLLQGPDWREALRLLVLTEEAAASIVRYQGSIHASALISERMRDTARRLEDPVMTSLAAFQRAHASSACGVYTYSRAVASGAAETLSRHATGHGVDELLGMLLLTSAYACYGSGVPGDADSYVTEAKRLADGTGDTMTLSLFFGPTNIRIWELSMETDGGEPSRAIALARMTEPERVPQIQRQSTFHLDTGRAFAYLRRDDDALRHLIEAERLAPAHVRADPLVWETVRDIVERRQRRAVSPEVRAFCGRLGVAL